MISEGTLVESQNWGMIVANQERRPLGGEGLCDTEKTYDKISPSIRPGRARAARGKGRRGNGERRDARLQDSILRQGEPFRHKVSLGRDDSH